MTGNPPLLERLRAGVLLADGAMGTMLHQSGSALSACFDALNTEQPEHVTAIHQAFLTAGAELLETNTFGANRFKLAMHGKDDALVAINKAGVNLARQAIASVPGSRTRYVAGAVGPLGVRLAPYGRVAEEQAFEAFREQLEALNAAGVDVFIFETFSDLNEIGVAIRAARAVNPNLAVIASMTFTRDDRTLYGDAPREVANHLVGLNTDVIGVNCSGGPSQLARIGQIMRAVEPDSLISVMPNAGFPESVGGRVMYPATADYFGDYALTFRSLGINVVGGCCGTTPAHIKAMRDALDDDTRRQAVVVSLPEQYGIEFSAPEQPTQLSHKLTDGKFVFTVEMAPPRSFNAQKVIASAQMLRDAGVDTINVSDSPMARMRMSPWAVCYLIQTELDMETVLHFPTRGRNMLRVQGDLLAAHALNVRNLFVVMGDPTNIGDYPEAHDKYDIVPSGLIRLIKHNLNAGTDQLGNSIGQPTSFLVGAALSINASDVDAEIRTLRKKIEAGADFALTQTIYEPKNVERFLKRYEALHGPLRLPILAGILPIYGSRHAAFLHNEVPGIEIPDWIMHKIIAAGDPAPAVGVEIAAGILRDLDGMIQGAYVIPPFGKYEMAADLVDAVGQRA